MLIFSVFAVSFSSVQVSGRSEHGYTLLTIEEGECVTLDYSQVLLNVTLEQCVPFVVDRQGHQVTHHIALVGSDESDTVNWRSYETDACSGPGEATGTADVGQCSPILQSGSSGNGVSMVMLSNEAPGAFYTIKEFSDSTCSSEMSSVSSHVIGACFSIGQSGLVQFLGRKGAETLFWGVGCANSGSTASFQATLVDKCVLVSSRHFKVSMTIPTYSTTTTTFPAVATTTTTTITTSTPTTTTTTTTTTTPGTTEPIPFSTTTTAVSVQASTMPSPLSTTAVVIATSSGPALTSVASAFPTTRVGDTTHPPAAQSGWAKLQEWQRIMIVLGSCEWRLFENKVFV